MAPERGVARRLARRTMSTNGAPALPVGRQPVEEAEVPYLAFPSDNTRFTGDELHDSVISRTDNRILRPCVRVARAHFTPGP